MYDILLWQPELSNTLWFSLITSGPQKQSLNFSNCSILTAQKRGKQRKDTRNYNEKVKFELNLKRIIGEIVDCGNVDIADILETLDLQRQHLVKTNLPISKSEESGCDEKDNDIPG